MSSYPRLNPIARDTLWDRAYAALKMALVEGRYAPGDRIVLREVAEELGISLTPVRDAVNRLVAEKILERGSVGQGGGASVPLLDAHQFAQLMAVRSSLEPMATLEAARHATAASLDLIEASLLEMRHCVETRRSPQYLQAHHRFHFGIYALSGLDVVNDLIESAWLRCGPTLTLALPNHIPDSKRYGFHVRAYEALRAGDALQAAAAIREDIESARDDICALLPQKTPAGV